MLKCDCIGLKGELTITPQMEELMNALFLDSVPGPWEAKAYPSTFGLGQWYADLLLRIKELEIWSNDFSLPNTVSTKLAPFSRPKHQLAKNFQPIHIV